MRLKGRVVPDPIVEIPAGNGMTELRQEPNIQYFKFEKRPMPRKSHKNLIIAVASCIASFAAGVALVGMWFYPWVSAPVLIGTVAYIILIIIANRG